MADIADIFRAVQSKLDTVSSHERKTIRAITNCRTESLGGNAFTCQACGHAEVHYNSCRNRHCPKCQNLSRMEWVSNQLQKLLPVPYFHAVFTIPGILKPLALHNKKKIYSALFYSVHKALAEVAKREENLGATIGGISVLHTWNQQLAFHPHIHCILPGIGIGPDARIRQAPSVKFFLPVKKLSPVFRGIFLRKLEQLYASGDLKTEGAISNLGDPRAFKYLLTKSCMHDWVVYLKAPFGGPEKVFQYLGKYTHRVGMSNQRIVSFENNSVVFSYVDRADNNIRKLAVLDALVFAKRFILHILPRGFVKIRYFGFLGNRVRKHNLTDVKEAVMTVLGLDEELLPQGHLVVSLAESYMRKEYRCPLCGRAMILSCATSIEGVFSNASVTPSRHCGSAPPGGSG
jgi:hypothetical protein